MRERGLREWSYVNDCETSKPLYATLLCYMVNCMPSLIRNFGNFPSIRPAIGETYVIHVKHSIYFTELTVGEWFLKSVSLVLAIAPQHDFSSHWKTTFDILERAK